MPPRHPRASRRKPETLTTRGPILDSSSLAPPGSLPEERPDAVAADSRNQLFPADPPTVEPQADTDSPAPPDREPVILTRAEHSISRKDIDENALRVLYRLSSHGYHAYLVGGDRKSVV